MARVIGVRHRVKKTKKGEAKPTLVVILDEALEPRKIELVDEDAELDFVLGRLPVAYRVAKADEDFSEFLQRHVLTVKQKGQPDKTKVPVAYEGLSEGDTVAMIMGGSGGNLVFSLSRRAEEIQARVMRIPPIRLKENRISEKEDDAFNLAELFTRKPWLFYLTEPRDREVIDIRETFRARMYAMGARIACQQRIRQNLEGKVFRNSEGKFPEGAIEALYREAKANDSILQNLLVEEAERNSEMLAALKASPIYKEIFRPIEGIGAAIAAGIISAVVDIRRFPTKPKFRKFCGVHCTPDGKFPRRRRQENDETGNDWTPAGRQAFWLAAVQFNRRPGTEWNVKLKQRKAHLRSVHPVPEKTEGGKMRYTPIHIQRMGKWQASTKFANWLWGNWWALERRQKKAKEEVA